MSAPMLLGCAAAALCLGLPVIAVSAHLEADRRAAGAADTAALAAADAFSGWSPGEPCALAGRVAAENTTVLTTCSVDAATAQVRVEVTASSPFGSVSARARAGPEFVPEVSETGEVGANGWAWPSDRRAVTQDAHDGFALDLGVTPEGALYAPYDGIVVQAGPDGGGLPDACRLQPEWWRGENYVVLVRHEHQGRVIYSSHNHVAPGSPQRFGVQPGARVRAGQRVATAGMSGCTSGLHTHFTLSTRPTNGHADIDPYVYIGRP